MRKWVYGFMVLIAVFIIYPLVDPHPQQPHLAVVASAPQMLKFLWIAGGLVSLVIFFGWVKLSFKREQRRSLALIPGLFLLFQGSTWLGLFLAERIVTANVTNIEAAYSWFIFQIIVGIIALLGSYFLCFRKPRIEKPTEIGGHFSA